MKKILITGGAGSMGREISFILSNKGYDIRVFDIPVANFEGLEEKGIETVKGDIGDYQAVKKAVENTDMVVHLAAILPPASEVDRERAFKVNVDGTKNIVDAIKEKNEKTRLIFTSTVATYGDTTNREPPVDITTPQTPNSNYSNSKVYAERYILDAGIDHTILRVTGVVLAELLDPPEWPFIEKQRVEFISRNDVVDSIVAAVEREEAKNKVFIIAGGKTWQMKGYEFVKEFFKVLDIPVEDAEYTESPVYSDWYDTEKSQKILEYQNTSFPKFLEIFQRAVDEVLC